MDSGREERRERGKKKEGYGERKVKEAHVIRLDKRSDTSR